MENYIQRRNIDALKSVMINKCDIIDKLIQQHKIKKENKHALIDVSLNKEKICAYVNEELGTITYLNSRYDAQYAATVWTEGMDDLKYRSIIVLYGNGNGMYASSLLSKMGDGNDILIYEPDLDIFLETISNIDLTKLFLDKRVHIYVNGINEEAFRGAFKTLCTYERANYTKIVFTPNYYQLFHEKADYLVDVCMKEIKSLECDSATFYHYAEEMNDNIIDNLKFISETTSINVLKSELEKLGAYQDAPAIIVGAGPSLDKNVRELKDSKGKSFIIATDSSILTLMRNDIVPDLLVTVDPHKPMMLFEREDVRSIPYLVCMQSRYDVMKVHTGKKILFASEDLSYNIYRHFGHEIDLLISGGSVACIAFSLAEFLGFRNIVLIGQDLAFTNNKKHATEIYNEAPIDAKDHAPYDIVKDIEGNDILTYANFKLYKHWFEAEIEKNPNTRVINATEGGAMIEGSEVWKLREVNERLCNKNVNFENVVRNLPLAFNEEDRIEIMDFVESLSDMGEKIDRVFQETLKLYQKMNDISLQSDLNNKELKDIVNQIDRNNAYCENSVYMGLVRMYAKEEEYNTLTDVYDSDDKVNNVNEDIRYVSKKGIVLLQGYIDANQKVLKRLKNISICADNIK